MENNTSISPDILLREILTNKFIGLSGKISIKDGALRFIGL